MRVDAVGHIAAVEPKCRGNVFEFQLAVEIELLLFHQLSDAIHQFIVRRITNHSDGPATSQQYEAQQQTDKHYGSQQPQP